MTTVGPKSHISASTHPSMQRCMVIRFLGPEVPVGLSSLSEVVTPIAAC